MKTCLVVDDSKVIRKVARHILETLDFEVAEAGDGRDALTQCEASVPDVVLLDWNMPVMNGIECLRRLREEFAGRALKVLMCTTEAEFSRILEAMQAGADEYIMKPFTADIVQGKLAGAGAL